MADAYKKISDFTKASEFGDNDLLLVSQTGTTRALRGTTLKEFAKAAGVEAAKISNAVVNANGHLIFTTTDGTSFDAGKVDGEDGVSIVNVAIDENYHLILELSDGSTKDAGYCRGASGSGTGDMLEEAYDSNGIVKAAGGIPTYIANELSGVMYSSNYDEHELVLAHGGIPGYVAQTVPNLVAPVGTVLTTINPNLDSYVWMECDGSSIDFSTAPAVWQMLHSASGASFPQLEQKETVASGLSYQFATSRSYADLAGSYSMYQAVSGMSGSNAVLNIYKYSRRDAAPSLIKTFTVSGKNTNTYPCSLCGISDWLCVAWAVGTNIKLCYTQDGTQWSEIEIVTKQSVEGHQIDLAIDYELWGVCDCTNGALYTTQTPGDASSWTKFTEPKDCAGYNTVCARLSKVAGTLTVVRNAFGSDDGIQCVHILQYPFEQIPWVRLYSATFTTASMRQDMPLSQVSMIGSEYCFASVYAISSELRNLDLQLFDTYGRSHSCTIDILSKGSNCTAIDLEANEYLAVAYKTTDDSTSDDGALACANLDAGFFSCGTLGNGVSAIVGCYSDSFYVLDKNGILWKCDFDADTVNLPDISLPANTKTYIKVRNETY